MLSKLEKLKGIKINMPRPINDSNVEILNNLVTEYNEDTFLLTTAPERHCEYVKSEKKPVIITTEEREEWELLGDGSGDGSGSGSGSGSSVVTDDTVTIDIPIEEEVKPGATGKLYLLEINGKDYILKETKINKQNWYIEAKNITEAKEIDKIKYLRTYTKNSVVNKGMIIAKNNNYYNMVLINYLLDLILPLYSCNNFVYQYDVFLCHHSQTGGSGWDILRRLRGAVTDAVVGVTDAVTEGTSRYLYPFYGYNIIEKCNGDLADIFDGAYLSRNIYQYTNGEVNYTFTLEKILRDIFKPLVILKQDDLDYLHADLKCKNVFFKLEDGNIIFKIADYDKNSITWNGIRFRSDYDGGMIESRMHTSEGITYEEDGFYCNASESNFKRTLMFNGNPMLKNYDYYSIMISILLEPNITIEGDEFLEYVLSILFRERKNEIIEKIVKYSKTLSPELRRKLSTINIFMCKNNIKIYDDVNRKLQILLKLNFDPIYPTLGMRHNISKNINLSYRGNICLEYIGYNPSNLSDLKKCITVNLNEENLPESIYLRGDEFLKKYLKYKNKYLKLKKLIKLKR
jgi:hypothetical protein